MLGVGDTSLVRQYWMIYRGPGFLAVVWFGSTPTPFSLLLSATCLFFSVFLRLCVGGRAYWGERGEGVGMEPIHTTTWKLGPLLIIHVSGLGKCISNYRGKILGRNPDKSLKSFPPWYSQSPAIQLYLAISISSNSRNLLQFLQFSNCTLERRKEENLIENRIPFHMVSEIHTDRHLLQENNP